MKRTLVARLKRLESRRRENTPLRIRIGVLKMLPEDYSGEKHVAVVNPRPTAGDMQWCEFEERPGRGPMGCDDSVPRIYLTEDEANF